MTTLLRACLLLLVLTTSASAQQFLFVDSVLFHTGAPWTVDRAVYRVFGFGSAYTDGLDATAPVWRERELPAFPPQSFYVLYFLESVPAWTDRDLRAIPDSVASGRATHFSLVYEFEIQRDQNPAVTIVYPRPFPANIDSINFRDDLGATGGLVFSETITSGPDSVVIPNNNLTHIRMVVYYNAANIPTAIRGDSYVAGQSLRVIPNPVLRGSGARVLFTPSGSGHLEIVNGIGEIVHRARIEPAGTTARIDSDDLTPGVYAARAIRDDGRVVAVSTFVVSD